MSYHDFKKLTDEAINLVKDPDFFINNYFAELRNTMDLTKENNIQLIEENHARLIK